MRLLDPAKTAGFPANWVVSDRAALSWSDDNQRVYLGIKAQVAVPDARRPSTDETADVDVWNSIDERIQSQQMVRAEADRNFTYRAGFDVTAGTYIKLADETMRDIEIAADREVGGRPRHARLRPRLQAPGGRRLPREHDDRRAHADVQRAR